MILIIAIGFIYVIILYKTMPKNILANIIFNFLFWSLNFIFLIIICPLLLMPQKYCYYATKKYCQLILFLSAKILQLQTHVLGKIKKNIIIASQHQSILEILAICAYFHKPVFFYKKELNYVPILGFLLKKLNMISVNRTKKNNNNWVERAKKEFESGKTIVIFPEGKRMPNNYKTHYKFGVFKLSNILKQKITPIALNTGLFWPPNKFMKAPGIAKLIVGEAQKIEHDQLENIYKELSCF